jgi:rhamnose transport system permease protein
MTRLRFGWDKGVVLLLVLTLVIGSLTSPRFFTASNLGFVVQDIGEIMIIALIMTFIIITGEIDLSVGSMVALTGCVLGVAWHHGLSMWVAAALALLTGALCGALNGFLVTKVGLPSLAVTIGTLGLFRGLCWALLGDTTVADFPANWLSFGYGTIPGTLVPWVTPILVVLVLMFGVVLHLTRTGRWVYATGQSAQAARFAGIPVARLKFRLYVLSGLLSGLAGIVYSMRFASARPDAAIGLELAVIAAVLFGGVSIFGGVGTIWGVVSAVLFLGAIRSLLQLHSVPPNELTIITGLLLLASVVIPVVAARLGGLRRTHRHSGDRSGTSEKHPTDKQPLDSPGQPARSA